MRMLIVAVRRSRGQGVGVRVANDGGPRQGEMQERESQEYGSDAFEGHGRILAGRCAPGRAE